MKAITVALEAARARDQHPSSFLGVIQLYCESIGCPVRTVEMFFKEYERPLPPSLKCPACHRVLKLEIVQTLDEHEQAEEAEARRSVNIQRWRAAHPGELFMPISILLGDADE